MVCKGRKAVRNVEKPTVRMTVYASGMEHSVLEKVTSLHLHIFKVPSQTLGISTLTKCNTIIYSCLCGSLLESVQEGNGEIDI